MSLPVVLTDEAWTSFEAIYEQIEQRLGKKAAIDFYKQTFKTLKNLETSPYIFKTVDEYPNLRKGLIKKLSSFYYQVMPDKIEVITFWDNRQDPLL